MAASDDSTLIKVAVWGLAMSIFCTAGLTLIYSDTANSDYSFDEINDYRKDLSSFTGQSMLSATPWVLTSVKTPWLPEDGVNDQHLDEDGWLYGEEIDETQYYATGTGTIFRMDPDQKSSVPISVSNQSYTYTNYYRETSWWDGKIDVVSDLLYWMGFNHGEKSVDATVWNYTGYRFILDPTLPFLTDDGQKETSVRDGSLSLVWYSYNAQEGLSGGLDVYGGDVLLASYSATDIVSAYDSSSGYATTYDFDFQGTHLDLNIRFDADDIESGKSLMQAWSEGDWTCAVTSVSAGLFLDIQNSNAYSITMGSMIQTFTQIYTFSMPEVSNPFMQIVLWIMVGLPMTIALALVVMRVARIAAEAMPF